MSDGYQVVQQDIRDAASDLRDVADGVEAADPSGVVTDIAGALPGSQSAGAARSLSTAWSERFGSWSRDAADRSDALDGNADNYDAAEHAAVQQLQALPDHLVPR